MLCPYAPDTRYNRISVLRPLPFARESGMIIRCRTRFVVEGDVRALITGITGFAGSFLTEHLLTHENIEIFGLGLPNTGPGHIAHLLDRVHLSTGSLDNGHWVRQVIAETHPDCVFHLAAQAAPSLSIADPTATIITNVIGQVNLFQACLAEHMNPTILVIGSGDEYGLVQPEDLPIIESTSFRPTNPYAVSKIAQDMLGLQYFLAHGLRCVRVRPFNHIGPRQSDVFVVSSFARQVAEAEAGLQPPLISVGNLESARDFTDVRDMVRAYWLAITMGVPGEVYNIGSGIAYGIRDILNQLVSMSRIPLQVHVDPAKLRATDVPEVRCDCARFARLTGWLPAIPMEKTLVDILDYWRARVTAKP